MKSYISILENDIKSLEDTKSKKKIKYSYIVIKKRAHLLVEILMKEGNIYVKDF